MSLLKNESILIIRYPTPTLVKGHYIQGTPSFIYALANVQPINGDELLLLPEGNRKKGTIKIYSETEIIDNDILRRVDNRYTYNIAQINTCTVDVALDSTDYTCTINGTVFTHTSIVGATILTIVAGLVSEINLGSELVTAVDNLDGTYTLTSDIKGTLFTVSVDVNQSVVLDVENITEEYKIMQDKDYSVHDIPHYKVYGFLMGT